MELAAQEMLIYVGLILGVLIAGLYMYRKDILFLLKKEETNGVIVNWMAGSEKGKKYFYPMIEFSPDGISNITFRAEERCEGTPLYAPGTKVIIKYLPTDPEYRKVVYPKG